MRESLFRSTMKPNEASPKKETQDQASYELADEPWYSANVILATGETDNIGRHIVSRLQRPSAAVRASTSNTEYAGFRATSTSCGLTCPSRTSWASARMGSRPSF